MDKIKKGLGRGLSSLIGETKVESQKNQLSISDLVPNKYKPRKITVIPKIDNNILKIILRKVFNFNLFSISNL